MRGKERYGSFFNILTLAPSLQGRGKDAGSALFTDKICAEQRHLLPNLVAKIHKEARQSHEV